QGAGIDARGRQADNRCQGAGEVRVGGHGEADRRAGGGVGQDLEAGAAGHGNVQFGVTGEVADGQGGGRPHAGGGNRGGDGGIPRVSHGDGDRGAEAAVLIVAEDEQVVGGAGGAIVQDGEVHEAVFIEVGSDHVNRRAQARAEI